MRKIAQIKRIDSLEPIDNADNLETAVIGGWRAVVRANEFHVGQYVLYFEVDTFLPQDVPEFAFLSERSTKRVNHPKKGCEDVGHVLKTMKLRGQVSQGLILPLQFGLNDRSTQDDVDAVMNDLGVFKWEPPIPDGGSIVGQFPNEHAQKTDAERVQNLTDEFLQSLNRDEWVATEKIDGTSSTFFMLDDGLHVATRNWEVTLDSLQGHVAHRYGLADVMPVGSVIQAEIFGDGVQKNPLKQNGTTLRVFNASTPVDNPDFDVLVQNCAVPRHDLTLPYTVDACVEQVFGLLSRVNPQVQAEGVVWWNVHKTLFTALDNRPNFKAINNKMLLKKDEK